MLGLRDHVALTLAATPYRYEARRVADARELVGYSETRFHARVGWLLDQAEAEAAMPVEVSRLRRLRDLRRGVR